MPVRLRLSVDRRCPKYEGKEKKQQKKERWAVEAGRRVIRPHVSCAGGWGGGRESRVEA
jgi:hypothetical protein